MKHQIDHKVLDVGLGLIRVITETNVYGFRFVIEKKPAHIPMYGIRISKESPFFTEVWAYFASNVISEL